MNIRTRGMLQCLGSGALFALMLWWFMHERQTNPENALMPSGPVGLVAFGAPGAFAIAGLMQWIAGVPFSDMSDRWNALAGWKQALIGLGVFFGGLVLLFGGLMVYSYLFDL